MQKIHFNEFKWFFPLFFCGMTELVIKKYINYFYTQINLQNTRIHSLNIWTYIECEWQPGRYANATMWTFKGKVTRIFSNFSLESNRIGNNFKFPSRTFLSLFGASKIQDELIKFNYAEQAFCWLQYWCICEPEFEAV